MNHYRLDMVIFLIHDGERERVGTALASASSSFTVPARLLGQGRELLLLGDPVGSTEQVQSERMVVQPGQYVEWILESRLARSTTSVY